MQVLSWRRGAGAAWCDFRRLRWMIAAAGTLTLAACNTDGQPTAIAGSTHGASVAFESIDGPPQGQFYKLVRDLNDEAQTRQLAVVSRETSSEYRVRGYLATEVAKGQSSITWVWDVFGADGSRALRISGAEALPGKHRDAWAAADDAVLQRIARSSMDQLGAFLTSSGVAPSEAPTLASFSMPSFSPEAAGIFRIFHSDADPVSNGAETPPAETPDEAVPLPRSRPTVAAAVSDWQTVAIAASER
jgi:hypothetical protein